MGTDKFTNLNMSTKLFLRSYLKVYNVYEMTQTRLPSILIEFIREQLKR